MRQLATERCEKLGGEATTNNSYHIYDPTVVFDDIKTNKRILAFKTYDGENFLIFERHRENLTPEQKEKFEEIWISFRDNAFNAGIGLFDIQDIMSHIDQKLKTKQIPFVITMEIMDHSSGKKNELKISVDEIPKELKNGGE